MNIEKIYYNRNGFISYIKGSVDSIHLLSGSFEFITDIPQGYNPQDIVQNYLVLDGNILPKTSENLGILSTKINIG